MRLGATALALGITAVLASLTIGYIAYRSSMAATETQYHQFYLEKAQVLSRLAELYPTLPDDKLLAVMQDSWASMAHRPADEYICVVDDASRLKLHTAAPQTIGNYAGENTILGSERLPARRLKDLRPDDTRYVGDYISSAGQAQVAAFVGVPERGWVLGVHRSQTALQDEVRGSIRPLALGLLAVCGLMMPAALAGLFLAFRAAESRRAEAEAELERQQLKAVQADRLKSLGEMAAGIAHELNQPLTAISSIAEGLCLRLTQGREMPVEQVCERMEDQLQLVDRMVGIIDHMRVFARDTADEDAVVFDVGKVVDDVLKFVHAQMRARGIQLDVDVQPDLPPCRGWPGQVEEVLLNLLTNARDALEERGEARRDGDETGWHPRVALTVRADADPVAVRIVVADNGPGISDAVRARILEPFYTTKEVGKGTGLGLSISRGIVDRHGGRLEIDGGDGDGATFTVVLPADSGARPPAPPIA